MDYKQAFLSQLENMYLGVQIQYSSNLFADEAVKKGGFIIICFK